MQRSVTSACARTATTSTCGSKGRLAHYLDDPYTPFVERAAVDGPRDRRLRRRRLRRPAHRRAARRGRDRATCASSRRPATSAAPGTGTAIRAPSATPRRSSTCRCWKRPSTCRPRSTPTPPRSSSTAAASASTTASTTNALFHTEVTGPHLGRSEASRWLVTHQPRRRLHRGASSRLGTGPLHVPKLPGIPGHRDASRATRSTPAAGTTPTPAATPAARPRPAGDKRVAIIGTGATAVQCVPHLARACWALYVFQRTPSSVDVRGNAPIDPDVVRLDRRARAGRSSWLENFAANQTGALRRGGPRQDGWTDISRRIRVEDHDAARQTERTPQRHARRLRGLRLREDGGDPRPGRRHRRGPRRPRSA